MKSKDGHQGYNGALLEIEKMISLINEQSPLPEYHAQENVDFKCNVSKEEYCNMIEKTKAYIREEIFFRALFQEDLKLNITAV